MILQLNFQTILTLQNGPVSSGLTPEKIVCYHEDFDKRRVLHNVLSKSMKTILE